MHARNRTWALGSDPAERCRQRILPVEGGDGSTLSLDFTTGVLDPRLTFTRASGGTYVANDGYIYGMDFATSSSLAIGTGSKSVTLTATAGVDRRYLVGQTVYISNGVNNMSGPVTAYNASTQVLTINATATSGSGSFTSWSVGNASARFDHDPTTLAPKGLLIEGTATNLLQQSAAVRTSPWTVTGLTAAGPSITAPDGTANGVELVATNGTAAGNGSTLNQATANAAAPYTFSIFLQPKGVAVDTNVIFQARDSAFVLLSNFIANFNHSTQAFTIVSSGTWTATSVNSVPVGNGWYRVLMTGTTPATTAWLQASIRNAATGNGTDGVYAWGAQLETGSGASSYIPTGASTGSRAFDYCEMGNITTLNYSTTNGSMLYEGQFSQFRATSFATMRTAFCTAAGATEAFGAFAYGATMYPTAQDGAGNTALATISPVMTLNTNLKAAWSLNTSLLSGEVRGCINGGSVAASGATSMSATATPTILTIGGRPSYGLHYPCGTIKSVRYWPTTLSDAQLQALTT